MGTLEAARRLGIPLVGMRVTVHTTGEVDAPGTITECAGDRAYVRFDVPTNDEGARWIARWFYVIQLRPLV